MHIFGVLRPKRKGVKEYDLIVDSVMSGVEGDGILRGKVFLFSMTRLMFSDIKSHIGTSMGYMTGKMELLTVKGISMEEGEGFNICNRAHILIISSR